MEWKLDKGRLAQLIADYLETFLGGMETILFKNRPYYQGPLKPSLVEWKLVKKLEDVEFAPEP